MTVSASPKKILLTRPRASSARWAALLARHRFACLIEPLLLIRATGTPRPPGTAQAVMITSANAVDALEENRAATVDLLNLPCFCVGAVTSEAARTFGFTDIRCGDSGSAGLARLISAALPDKARPILHIAGDNVDAGGQEALAAQGYEVTPWTVYEAEAAADFSPDLIAAFRRNEIAAIPVFSPRSARILISLIEKNRLASACHGIAAIGLSQPVADVLQSLPWRRLCVAAKPSEDDILACLQGEPVMTESLPSAPVSAAAPKAKPPRRKTSGAVWAVMILIAAAGLGVAGYRHSPWLRDAVMPNAQNTQDLDSLERRVSALETEMRAQKDTTPPAAAAQAQQAAPVDAGGLAALSGNVRTLQAQLAQQAEASRIAAQKLVAEAFAFWDLRAAAQSGHGFAPQLAALRAAAAGDDALAPLLARLDPHAAAGAPSFAQLRDELAGEENLAAAPMADTASGWWPRLRAALSHLISVHPARPAQFATLEAALRAGDADAAQAAFAALPDATRQNFSEWDSELQARAAIDGALHEIAAHFTAPPASAAPDSAP